MEATIQRDFYGIFSTLTPREKIKNKQLKKQSKKLKELIDRFSGLLRKNIVKPKRGQDA